MNGTGFNEETIYKGVGKSSGKLQGKTECGILFTYLGLKEAGEEVVIRPRGIL